MKQGLKEKIKQRDFKLQSLLEITTAINANAHIDDLLSLYQSILIEQLKIGKTLLVSTQDDNLLNLVVHGFENPNQWHGLILDHVNKHKSKIETIEAHGTQVVIVPIEKDGKPLALVVLGDNNEEEISLSPSIKHMRFVQTLTGVLVVAIQNKKLVAESIAQAGLQRELELAAEMQNMLLPKKLPNTPSLKVNAYYKSHGQVGGDYYDFIPINEQEWICCIADVSGKGVSAAFLMSGLQAQLRGLIEIYGSNLEKIVSKLNTKVLQSAQGEKFITFFIGHFNEQSRCFTYINCGHNPGYIYENKKQTWLHSKIPALGIMDQFHEIKPTSINLSIGAQILLYTDGLVEVENDSHESFGELGITQTFDKHGADFKNSLLIDEVNHFIGKMNFIDDIALLHLVTQ